ncbi:MAG TPA: hypothetical protein VHU84_14345 [Lacipirellulaceae bacterium]|jgi:hypothetical protein|nr:hypothetical protein [Lacipirellulaceae bacterium]
MIASHFHNLLLSDITTNLLSDLDHDQRFTLLVVTIGCATGVICTVTMFVLTTINSIHKRRVDAEMKREMLDRGMNADDIAKIIESAAPPEDGTQRWIASWARKRRCS